MKYLNSNVLTGMLFLLFSASGNAHVRWFVDPSTTNQSFEWTPVYFLLIGLAYAFGLVSYVIDRKFKVIYQYQFFNPWKHSISQWRLLSYACGITLILISFYGIFLAPNVEITHNLESYLLFQALCGTILLAGFPLLVSGLAILVLCLLTMFSVPATVWIDYIFEFIAIGIALCISNKASSSSITCLRMGLGLQLMVLALHNKLLDPSLGLQFLQQYQWNFMALIGFNNFNDLLFVFAAGLAELTFGILIFFAIGTRFVVLAVSFFFLLTSILLGLHELIGHIPIIFCCLVLYSLGDGYSARQWVSWASGRVLNTLSWFGAQRKM